MVGLILVAGAGVTAIGYGVSKVIPKLDEAIYDRKIKVENRKKAEAGRLLRDIKEVCQQALEAQNIDPILATMEGKRDYVYNNAEAKIKRYKKVTGYKDILIRIPIQGARAQFFSL